MFPNERAMRLVPVYELLGFIVFVVGTLDIRVNQVWRVLIATAEAAKDVGDHRGHSHVVSNFAPRFFVAVTNDTEPFRKGDVIPQFGR
jgi:hypothetical protein